MTTGRKEPQTNAGRSAIDRAAGFEVGPDFARFDQINDVFSRAFWDESVRSADTDAFLTAIVPRPPHAGLTVLRSATSPFATPPG